MIVVYCVGVVVERDDYSTLKQSEMPDMQCLDQLAPPLTSAASPPLSQSTEGSLTTSPGFPFISAVNQRISLPSDLNYRLTGMCRSLDIRHCLLATTEEEAGLTGGHLVSVNAVPANRSHLLLVCGDDSDLVRKEN